jgi:hypothetical protein
MPHAHPTQQQTHPPGHASKPNPAKLYNPRHPERTLLYTTVADHFETWHALASAGQFDGQGDHHTPKPYVRQAFRKYLECGIFVYGCARCKCDDCAHDYFVAFSCKARGVCPSCNTRRMAEAAAHLTDHVFPHLPVRQWVLSVPKRLRYYIQRDGSVLNMVLRIFLRVIEQTLIAHSPGKDKADTARKLHIGAVAFIHRFGSSLNEHVHFHICVVDGVFEDVPELRFHEACGIDTACITQTEETLRKRILRAFVGRGLLQSSDAKDMLAHKHSGFSVDTSVRIGSNDRAGLERLLRYCARPPFALERLRKGPSTKDGSTQGETLVYRCAKQHSEPGSHYNSDNRGTKADEITLTPLELIARIAALVPPPRTHRHRYYGVLAPNSPLRQVVTALAQSPSGEYNGPQTESQTRTTPAGEGAGQTLSGQILPAQILPATVPTPPPDPKPKRPPSSYLWAVLIARIYEVFPLICPLCGGEMRIIAFITDGAEVRKILNHIGAESEPPRITPARGPPLWEDCDALLADGVQVEPNWDESAQVAPDDDADQSVSW